jgi:hypothetical protein
MEKILNIELQFNYTIKGYIGEKLKRHEKLNDFKNFSSEKFFRNDFLLVIFFSRKTKLAV